MTPHWRPCLSLGRSVVLGPAKGLAWVFRSVFWLGRFPSPDGDVGSVVASAGSSPRADGRDRPRQVFNMKPLQIVFPARADPESPVIDLDLHLPLLCFRPEKVLQVRAPHAVSVPGARGGVTPTAVPEVTQAWTDPERDTTARRVNFCA